VLLDGVRVNNNHTNSVISQRVSINPALLHPVRLNVYVFQFLGSNILTL